MSGFNASTFLKAALSNENCTSLKVGLASNNFEDNDASLLIQSLVKGAKLHTLDLSDNKFKVNIGDTLSVLLTLLRRVGWSRSCKHFLLNTLPLIHSY